ncbi:MAG: caspase family protein [Elusimicrobia bacterium]|nr:caspase family protein [Elusimicrobiota bacterium]
MRILFFALSLASLSWSQPDDRRRSPPPGGRMGGGPPSGYQPGPQSQPPPPDAQPPPPPPQYQQGQPNRYPPPQDEAGPTPKGPPGKAKIVEFKDTFGTMVEEYVDAHSRGGLFTVKPQNSEALLHLNYGDIEPKNVRRTPEGEAIGCVEFTLDGGKTVDLDFHATSDGWEWTVSRVFIHKMGGKDLLGSAGAPPPAAKSAPKQAPGASTEEDVAKAAPKAPVKLLEVDIPPKTSARADPEAYAVVIGIEKYRDVPKVDYAARDAQSVYDYLTQSMGFDSKNVALLQNERAGLADLDTYLGPWLEDRVSAKSKVMIYYAGHGAPNPKTGEGYLIPYDGNPTYVETKAFPVKRLYENLAKLPSKDVTVVLDACFSGAGGRSVLAKGARPLVMMKDAAPALGANTVALTAARGDQISTFDEEGRHGLLTYNLLKGLRGEADTDKDGKVTTEELFSYLGPAVERGARLQHVEQTPTLSPDIKSLGPRGRAAARSGSGRSSRQ